jgi:hypothetical protein
MIVYIDNEYIYGWYYQSDYRLIGDGTKETAERIEKGKRGKLK